MDEKREDILIKAPQQWKPEAKISPHEPTDLTFAHAGSGAFREERSQVEQHKYRAPALPAQTLAQPEVFLLGGTSSDLPVLPHVHSFIHSPLEVPQTWPIDEPHKIPTCKQGFYRFF